MMSLVKKLSKVLRWASYIILLFNSIVETKTIILFKMLSHINVKTRVGEKKS